MKPPLLTVDTNIFCAALITTSADSPVCQVLSAVRSGRAICVLSQPLLNEYRRVLCYPKLARIHGLCAADIDELLGELVLSSLWIDPAPAAEKAPDADDQHLWDLLFHDGRFVLVTGDGLLLAKSADAVGQGARILTAREVVATQFC